MRFARSASFRRPTARRGGGLRQGFRRARRRLLLAVAAVPVLLLASSAPAMAYEPVGVVHTEQLRAGPYQLTVGFSQWPLRAMQSLDFTFVPEGGIAGKSGILTIDGPGIEADNRESELARHPRKLDVWGLDVQALPEPGRWDLTFDINGPEGRAKGTLADLTVLDQPGPPLSVSWTVCALPVLAMLAFLITAWRRNKPSQRVAALIA